MSKRTKSNREIKQEMEIDRLKTIERRHGKALEAVHTSRNLHIAQNKRLQSSCIAKLKELEDLKARLKREEKHIAQTEGDKRDRIIKELAHALREPKCHEERQRVHSFEIRAHEIDILLDTIKSLKQIRGWGLDFTTYDNANENFYTLYICSSIASEGDMYDVEQRY